MWFNTFTRPTTFLLAFATWRMFICLCLSLYWRSWLGTIMGFEWDIGTCVMLSLFTTFHPSTSFNPFPFQPIKPPVTHSIPSALFLQEKMVQIGKIYTPIFLHLIPIDIIDILYESQKEWPSRGVTANYRVKWYGTVKVFYSTRLNLAMGRWKIYLCLSSADRVLRGFTQRMRSGLR